MILMLTFHIKFGLANQVKLDSKAFSHVQAMFPKLLEAKMKAGIFAGPQVWQALGSMESENKMSAFDRGA